MATDLLGEPIDPYKVAKGWSHGQNGRPPTRNQPPKQTLVQPLRGALACLVWRLTTDTLLDYFVGLAAAAKLEDGSR